MGLEIVILVSVLLLGKGMCLRSPENPDLYRVYTFQTSEDWNTTFNHFAVYEENIYVGGENSFFHLSLDNLMLNANITGADTGINKILQVAVTDTVQRLVTCGSNGERKCQLRNLSSINSVFPWDYDGVSVIPPDNLTCVGIVGDDDNNIPNLYIAQSRKAGVTNRPIVSLPLPGFVTNEDSQDYDPRNTQQFATAVLDTFLIYYVETFLHRGFTYFLASQRKNSLHLLSSFVPKLSRVCHNSTKFDEFTEIEINCIGKNDNIYSIAQAAILVEDELFIVFNENSSPDTEYNPTSHSALCVYNMSSLVQEFDNAVDKCACKQRNSNSNNNYLDNSKCSLVAVGFPEVCAGIRQEVRSNFPCATGGLFRYPELPADVDPIAGTVLLESLDTSFSSILITKERHHRMAFIGTREHKLLKVHLEDGSGRLYEVIEMSYPILSDTWLSIDSEHILVLSEMELVKMKVADCSQFKTCEECIVPDSPAESDPYCGWCTLEKSCTRFGDCAMASNLSRWLPHNERSCPAITQLNPPSLSVDDMQQNINLTVAHLPESPIGYFCHFNEVHKVEAIKNGDQLTCLSPLQSQIPQVTREDHVTMQLHVYSSETETNFITEGYNFYDCSKITSCSICVSREWLCDWCKLGHKCTHDNTECVDNDVILGTEENAADLCPQIIPKESIRLPVLVDREVTVYAKNLVIPEDDDSTESFNYKCHLSANVIDYPTPANVTMLEDGTFKVVCAGRLEGFTYGADKQTQAFNLTLKWKMENTVDNIQNVELYKCEVLRPDCSRCLSPETTPEYLGCGWCGSTSSPSCTVEDRCTVNWKESDQMCPAPNIEMVVPPNGPFEGGTVVTLTGTNLGRRFTDIVSITLVGAPCVPIGSSYLIGASVDCTTGQVLTAESGDAEIVLITNQTGEGAKLFAYQDPNIVSFTPLRGPESGGTKLTIQGHYLDTGNAVDAWVGNIQCSINLPISQDVIECVTAAGTIGSANVNLRFDGTASRSTDVTFSYEEDPIVLSVEPEKSIRGGGNNLTVTGDRFDLIATPMIQAIQEEIISEPNNCTRYNATRMYCPSPNLILSDRRKRRQTTRPNNEPEEAVIGFIMDGVDILRNWSAVENIMFLYYPDPIYHPFQNEELTYTKESKDIIQIRGENIDVGSSKGDVTVFIGMERCNITVFDDNSVFCIPPENQPAAGDIYRNNTDKGLPYVVVEHANLRFNIGYIRYTSDPTVFIIIGIVILIVVLVIVCIVIIYCLRKSKNKEVEQLLMEMSDLRTNIGEDMRTLFAMQQTAMTKFETNLDVLPVLPLTDRSQYIKNMLFLNLNVQPQTEPPIESETVEAMKKFSELLSNKSFLLVFIRTLDQEKTLPMMDRVNIASLITLSLLLEGKLDYLTDVMMTLMSEQIEDIVEKNRPRQLFRRNESIVEKLVSNWFAICLYDYLESSASEKIVQLYGAIKCIIEKGPIDAVTGKAQFSLSDEHMLESHIHFEEVTLQVIANEEDGEIASVTVLNVDTITQVKNKILDYLHRGRPYSTRPLASDMDLEWRQGVSGQLVLRDEGQLVETKDGWKKVNTLVDYLVENGSRVALIRKQAVPNAQLSDGTGGADVTTDSIECNETSLLQSHSEKTPLHRSPTLVEAKLEEGISLWHLIKEMETSEDVPVKSKKTRNRLHKKGIKEVLLPLLTSTRNSLQKYVDGAFTVMLSEDQNQVPKSIKFLFDFFDRQALKNTVDIPEVVNAWKNNVLPLRFWTTILANPTYIFDMRRSRYVEACLRVLVQVLRDACSKNDFKLTKDFAPSRLLYNSLLPKYSEQVESYYKHIQDIPRLNPDAIKEEFSRINKPFQNIFDSVSTMYQLYECVKKFNDSLNAALEEDDDCHNANLVYRMEQVGITLND